MITLIKRARKITPLKIYNKSLNYFINLFKKRHDILIMKQNKFECEISTVIIDTKKLCTNALNKGHLEYLTQMYLEHRFDLLGSGWVKNSYESKALGVENYLYGSNLCIDNFDKEGNWLEKIVLKPYLTTAKSVWINVSPDYKPIDWQKDYKSGYRYSAKKWYKDQKIAPLPGVDIKVPWELSRFQHLPQMAVFALKLKIKRSELIIEFKNQVLDFIATNPVRFGVNWSCTMDVAIRAANLLIAYDVFSQLDTDCVVLDNKFKKIFANSIYLHGVHIFNNLENKGIVIANHYLSNLAGLLFISKYINETKETSHWLQFSIKEFFIEFQKQFNRDGSNFESSTAYHRLSSEISAYSIAIILGMPNNSNLTNKNVIPDSVIEILYNSLLFSQDIVKPNGNIIQIGDNDSGRFIKLTPVGTFVTNSEAEIKYTNLKNYNDIIDDYDTDNHYYDENILNISPTIEAVKALFDFNDIDYIPEYSLEKSIIESLSNGVKIDYNKYKSSYEHIAKSDFQHFKFVKNTVFVQKDNITSLKSDLEIKNYKDFGLIIVKSSKLFISVYYADDDKSTVRGHSHNDKLSAEIMIDGKEILCDPGTYLYTSLPDKRNLFRMTAMHNTVSVTGCEQCDLDNVFNKFGNTSSHLLLVEPYKMKLLFTNKYYQHMREIVIMDHEIEIIDSCDVDFKINWNNFNLFSNGYGKLLHVKSV